MIPRKVSGEDVDSASESMFVDIESDQVGVCVKGVMCDGVNRVMG